MMRWARCLVVWLIPCLFLHTSFAEAHLRTLQGLSSMDCDNCPSGVQPVCVDGVTFRHSCLAACQGLLRSDDGPCAGDDIAQATWGSSTSAGRPPPGPEAAAAVKSVTYSDESRSAEVVSQSPSPRTTDMHRYKSEGFVLAGTLDLNTGPKTAWDPQRFKSRMRASPGVQGADQVQSSGGAAAAAAAAGGDSALQVRALRYRPSDGSLYMESTARPASSSGTRRRLVTGDQGELLSAAGWATRAFTGGSENAAGAAAAATAAAGAASGEMKAPTAGGSIAAADADAARGGSGSITGGPQPQSQSQSQRGARSGGRRGRDLLASSSNDTRWRVSNASAYPHSAIAYIHFRLPSGSGYFCTCTFITPWDVLTAAHCVWDFDSHTGYQDWQVWPARATAALSAADAYTADFVTFYRTENGTSTSSTNNASYADQRYQVNYYDIAVIRVTRPYTSWLGIKYDCTRATYPKTLACGYASTYVSQQSCSQCFLTTSQCRPMWQMYNFCYSTNGQSGMAIMDLADMHVLGVLSGGPSSDWNHSYWTPIDAFHFYNIVQWIWLPPPSPPPPWPPSPPPPPSPQPPSPPLPRPPSPVPPSPPPRPPPPIPPVPSPRATAGPLSNSNLRSPPPLLSPSLTANAKAPPSLPPPTRVARLTTSKPPPPPSPRPVSFTVLAKKAAASSPPPPLLPPPSMVTSLQPPPLMVRAAAMAPPPPPLMVRAAAMAPPPSTLMKPPPPPRPSPPPTMKPPPPSPLPPTLMKPPSPLPPTLMKPLPPPPPSPPPSTMMKPPPPPPPSPPPPTMTTPPPPDSCITGQLRLRDGPNTWSGRVELCRSGRWGTICDAGWGWDDANVACRQLGYNSSGDAVSGGWFPSASSSTPIHASSVGCLGNEPGVINCTLTYPAPASCDHRYDAGLMCTNGTAAESPPPGAGSTNGSTWRKGNYPCTENGTLRMQRPDVNDGYVDQGRLEVCLPGSPGLQWGSVCDDGWDDRDAAVACRQMGYMGGWAVTRNPDQPSSFLSNSPAVQASAMSAGPLDMNIWLSKVACTGAETNLTSCVIGISQGQTSCTHQEDVGVVCVKDKHNPPAPPASPPPECSEDGGLRLVQVPGLPAAAGRLEVCYNGRYGQICDTGFSVTEARVACRQLGYQYGRPMGPSNSSVAGNPGPGAIFWMGDVNCDPYGDASGAVFWRLTQCLFGKWGATSCKDPTRQALAVICSNDVGVMIPPPPSPPPPSPRPPLSGSLPRPPPPVFAYPCSSEGAVRLVPSTGSSSDSTTGRLDICHNGRWGAICGQYDDKGDSWDDISAGVVCRQLTGIANPRIVIALSATDPRVPPRPAGMDFWMYGVLCDPEDPSLADCQAGGWGIVPSTCGANDAVGLTCVA